MVRFKKVRLRDPYFPAPEFLENPQNSSGVFLTDRHEKIDVARVAGKPVNADRIATDDKVFNLLLF